LGWPMRWGCLVGDEELAVVGVGPGVAMDMIPWRLT
jgi:hypothetical protein